MPDRTPRMNREPTTTQASGHGSSQDHAPSTSVKSQRDGESATTAAADWFDAKCAGRRLPEHLLPGEKP